MFTGIVKAVGQVTKREDRGGPVRITIGSGALATGGWRIGDSIAVSGVCLTMVAVADGGFEADLSGETLARTTLGRLGPGSGVNLEPAVTAADALGGHLVTGHVDGIAVVRRVLEASGSLRAAIEAPAGLARYIAAQGSIALDGVSLTVAGVSGAVLEVDLVPHTRAATTLASLAAGQSLNLEVDLVARYLERLLEARG